MKSLYILFILSLFSSEIITSQESYFQMDPTLSPNGKTIVYSHNGDLWKVATTGGEALRLTAMRGEETLPRISPDGQWIAFSATQYGNRDVYVMPMNGGEIKQLTFHDMADDVDSWSWDSKTINFTSSRYNRFSGYQVALKGGTPKRMFNNYFNNVHNVIEHPKTGEIFFNESWESKNFTHRKRYKGDYNPNIKSYQPNTKKYTEHTTYNGKDMWATIDRNGTLFFASDEDTGEYNLFTFTNNKKTALTSFTSSIGRPQVSANGEKIVFTKDYQLFVYNVNSNKADKIKISSSQNNTLSKSQDFKVKGNISYFDVSPDNKKIAFVSRGELFVSDSKGKFIKKITTAKEERVLEVKWLKDNRTLLFTQTANGYPNLFTIAADGTETEKRRTKEAKNNVNISLDHELKRAVYVSGRDALKVIDLESFKSTTVVTDEFWALYAGAAYFSPNDEYLVYQAYRNFELDAFVYHFPTKKSTNLTNTGVSESAPVWSGDAKYIYFEGNLTEPGFPRGTSEAHIYRMALDKYEDPFTLDKFNELFQQEEKEENSKEKEKDKDEKKSKKEEKIEITINEVGLMDRLERIGPGFGLQGGTDIITKDETTYVYYYSNHDEGIYHLWRTVLEPFEKPKTEKVSDSRVNGFQTKSVKGSNYMLYGGDIHTVNVSSNKNEKIEIDATFRKSLTDEFNQMFHEAWAGFESNFYSSDFHGENWQQLRKKYAAFLPYLTSRAQLSTLFNDMLGELNTSHFGFNSNGEEDDTYYGTRTLATGILFEAANPYKVSGIVAKSPADITGKNILPGDVLVAVNGEKITTKQNRESYFSQPSITEEIQLTFSRNDATHTVNMHPTSSRNLRNLHYDSWVDANQSYTDKKANKRIAYVHMKNMTGGQLTNFKREMVSETYNRDALILDLRNNTGGNVHDDVLQFLSQKPYAQWKYREGALAPQPNFSPGAKPIVILINEQTLSDAEVTSAGFKELGLGQVIGTETYRWIIFTSGAGLVDGSFYRLPSWGCYNLQGDNLEKTGVQPDIYVKESFKDRLEGNQPQLDKAIEEIMKRLN